MSERIEAGPRMRPVAPRDEHCYVRALEPSPTPLKLADLGAVLCTRSRVRRGVRDVAPRFDSCNRSVASADVIGALAARAAAFAQRLPAPSPDAAPF